MQDKKIVKVVVTGGPCAGKTESLSYIKNYFSKKGWKVLIVPETATEFLLNGISDVDGSLTTYDFQMLVTKKQLYKEELYSDAVNLMKNKKILIIYDRGLLDGKSYVPEDVFARVLTKGIQMSEREVLNRYDGVIHMVTAAIGAKKHYNNNNPARKENVENAIVQDKKTYDSWKAHPYMFYIDNSTGIAQKIEKVIDSIEKIIELKQ